MCPGLLSGDGQRWLVPPDGTTAEFLFRSAQVAAVQVVVANCYLLDGGNPKSRFRVTGGSYSLLQTSGQTP